MSQNKLNKVRKSASPHASSATTRILWAVDPFVDEKNILRSAAWCLRALSDAHAKRSVWIEPVSVWADAPISPLMPRQDYLKILQKDSQEELEKILKKVKIPGIQPLRILPKPEFSIREAAQALIAHAKQSEAELIVVSSHGRKGVKRLLLGSFAETLSLYSDIPLMIVHSQLKTAPDLKTILFPTDFSEESQEAFARILEFAKNHGSKVTLFHQVPTAAYPAFGLAFSGGRYYEDALASAGRVSETQAKEWTEQAEKKGVSLEVHLDRSLRGGSVSDAILKQAKKRKAVIAMASHSGAMASVFLGSTTRQVIRSSDRPVWILHPRKISRKSP